MLHSRWFVLSFFLLASQATAADEGISAKKLDELKAATVYVKVESTEGGCTGTGFLVHVDGDNGLVVTNRHVAAAGNRQIASQKYSLVFFSGTRKEMVLPAAFVAADPDQDLAVLKVSSKNLPAPLDLKLTATPRETMPVYTLGFPLGEVLSTTRGNPTVTIRKGTVGSLPEDANGKLQRVQLDGELNPGNSGGPVVDSDGKLVGIAVAKIEGTTISFAIPTADLTGMLNGRAAAVVIKSLNVDNGVAELQVEIPIIDPLGKLKTVELRHVRKDALKEQPRAQKEGTWTELIGAEKIEVKVVDAKAVYRFALTGPERKPFDYLFQCTYTNAEGKRIATQPRPQGIDFGFSGLVHVADPKAAWETITSKEGGFTVDMPKKPTLEKSSTRRTKAGAVKVTILGCETDKGFYMVYRIDMPTAAPKGEEQKILDAYRDFFAEEWNGKVVTEKRVMVQRKYYGRDFTIKGKPDNKTTAAIRVRQFMIDKAIFAVIVMSAPDAELPEDSGRFLGSLSLGQGDFRASGTPEPEPKGTDVPGWGEAIDKDKDCKITAADKSLTIELPGTLHEIGGPQGKFNSPRVMREVDGDFVLTVKVAGEFKPGPKSTNPKSVPYASGGILIWVASDNFIRLERASFLRQGKFFPHVAFEETEGGYMGAVHNEPIKEGPIYLRMERKGSRILGAVSADGKTWKALKPIDTVWPTKLKVGLAANTTSSEPFSVRFEEYELKTSK